MPLVNPRAAYAGQILDNLTLARNQNYSAFLKISTRGIYTQATEDWGRSQVQLSTRMKNEAFRDMNYGLQLSMTEVVNSAVQYASVTAGEQVASQTRIQAETIARNKTRFKKMFESVGMGANNAAKRRYGEIRQGRNLRDSLGGKDVMRTSYRQGSRYSGGIMGKALSSPSMYLATTNGIAWPSFSYLDSSAKQWYRLNFGAGLRGQRAMADRKGTFQLSGTETMVADTNPQFRSFKVGSWASETETMASGVRMSFNQYGPSSSFMIPWGIWMSLGSVYNPNPAARGQHEFYLLSDLVSGGTTTMGAAMHMQKSAPLSGIRSGNTANPNLQRKKMTAGIAAWGFLEAGLFHISQMAPRGTTELVLEALYQTIDEPTTGSLSRLNIDPSRLETFASQAEMHLERYRVPGGGG